MNILSLLQGGDPISVIIATLYRIPAVLIALTLHELAHGYVALKCGDPTAQMLGRLSFNPLRHLDPLGALFMLIFGFGWARPVPVNPRNFGKFRRDDLLVSLAGVTLNFILFLFSMLVMVGINELLWSPALWTDLGYFIDRQSFLSFNGLEFNALLSIDYQTFYVNNNWTARIGLYEFITSSYMSTPWLLHVQRFFMNFASINLGLCLFNLLPIPPLDGYHVVNDIFLRGKLHIPAKVMNIIMFALFALMFFTNFLSNLLGNAIYFVQNGVLSGILWILGLG